MVDERPSFTIEAQARAKATLPLHAWAVTAFGAGMVAGALVGSIPCRGMALCAMSATPFLVAVVPSAALAAAAWLLLPIKGDPEAVVRAAAVLAFVGGVLPPLLLVVLAQFPNASSATMIALSFSPVGLAAPIVMLGATRPDAILALPGAGQSNPTKWLRAGALPAGALTAGLAVGLAVPISFIVGGAAVAAGALLVLLLASVSHVRDEGEAKPPESRGRMLLRLTPMLRYDALLEAGIVFSVAATALAAASSTAFSSFQETTVWALALGAALGALGYALFSPTIDLAFGRGRLVAIAGLSAALAPLALWIATPRLEPVALLAAASLVTFALASAPQRYALTFDLAGSRGRLRTSADLQGLKFLAVAAAFPFLIEVDSVAPGLALPAVSAISLATLAVFAPTLGTLGRRTS